MKKSVIVISAIFGITLFFTSCASNKLKLKKVEGEPVSFKETWGFVLQKYEDEYNPEFPLTDVCHYYADLNCYGEMIDVPKRSNLVVAEGTRVHFGMCCQSVSLTHFVINPEFGLRDKVISDIVKAASDYDGLQLDFEYVPRRDKNAYLEFVKEVRRQLDEQGKEQMLSVCVPGRYKISESDIYPYKELSQLCDRVFVMAYDEHWSTSKPGPVASTEWSKNVVDFAVTQIPEDKLVMGMPLYGRTWSNKSTSRDWYFETLARTLKENGVKKINYEDEVPMFTYKTEVEVTGYFNDIHSVVNFCRIYKDAGANKVGFWRVGFEEENFWDWISIEE